MKLQFTVQEYQTEAVDAVADVFAGQPRHDGVRYLMDPGRRPGELPLDPTAAFRNAEIALDDTHLLANVRGVQRARTCRHPTRWRAAPRHPMRRTSTSK